MNQPTFAPTPAPASFRPKGGAKTGPKPGSRRRKAAPQPLRPWPDSPDTLVNLKQVMAHRLPFSRAMIYRMSTDGRLPPPIKVGHNVWWVAGEIEDALCRLAELRTTQTGV
ncbi:hypothetical protein BB934_00090 [Microvirga ossetica]|uniref:Uncharacterized protein n=1 Tax=Microvirga ossetica TaxID=1882682 RepID=A0A1B2EA10_9HYPH|nr:AlpA family phage regulatory protein [Microvirga ossetica]ANY76815.1 hypothetical protein BB934_00090 [Microvirga ossetica]